MEEDLKKLYNVVHSRGMYTKDFDSFKAKYSQPENQDKLFSVLSDRQLYTKSSDEFKTKYFGEVVTREEREEAEKKEVAESTSKKKLPILQTPQSLFQKALQALRTILHM